MSRRIALILIVLGLGAFVGNGVSSWYKFSMTKYTWSLGFTPAIACLFLLIKNKWLAQGWLSKLILSLCVLGFVSLVAHLVFCEVYTLPVPHLELYLSSLYKITCYLLPKATLLLVLLRIFKH